jgi:polar amino acid transport system ATP-binding protein
MTEVGRNLRRVGGDTAPILALERISKSYGALQALDRVSLTVNRGEVVCLVGPSGSGKSTLLRCANALETLDDGRIVFDGAEVQANDPSSARLVRQRMGMVFQNFELFPHMTVMCNITIGPTTVLKLDRAAADRRARDLLAKVGLSDKRLAYPAALSGGQRLLAHLRWSQH